MNYIVRDDEVVIVDEFTGRVMPGRRWSDGLHQAIEAKERVDIQMKPNPGHNYLSKSVLVVPKVGGDDGYSKNGGS